MMRKDAVPRALVVGIAVAALVSAGCDKWGQGGTGPRIPAASAATGFAPSQQYTGPAIKSMDLGGKRCENKGTGLMTIDASGAVTLVATITGDIVVNSEGACDINGAETVTSTFRATIDPSKPASTITFTGCNREMPATGDVTFTNASAIGTLTCLQSDGSELFQLGVGLY